MNTSTNTPRISAPDLEDSPEGSQVDLNVLKKRIGFIPNVYKVLSNSPNVLSGFINFQSALGKTLDLKTRNGIALAVSERNGCEYCLSAHTHHASKGANTSEEEIALNRQGKSTNPKIGAAAKFAVKIIANKGRLDTDDLQELKTVGYTDAQIVEIIAFSVQVTFTNLISIASDIQPDEYE